MNDRLTTLLRDAADDVHPVVPNLVPRARANQRRRTAAVATLTVGALAVGGAVASQWQPTHITATPATSPSAPVTPPPPADDALPTATILERCLPQLASYDSLPMYDLLGKTPEWSVAHDFAYRAGDVAALTTGSDVRYCLIPEEGAAPIDPITELRPTLADPAMLAALCSESQRVVTNRDEIFSSQGVEPEFAFDTPDLRGADVVVGAEGEGFVAARLDKDGALFDCVATPLGYDLSGTIVTAVDGTIPSYSFAPYERRVMFGAEDKSIVDKEGSVTVGIGTAPEGVASFELSGAVKASVDVVDGAYAYVAASPNPMSDGPIHVVLRDAAGAVVHEETID